MPLFKAPREEWFQVPRGTGLQLTIQPQQKRRIENMTTLHLRKSIGRSPLRLGFLLVGLALGCFGLSPASRALLPPPPPDGGYPNFNTAEGTDALFNLTTGSSNTAIGYRALFNNTDGTENTATGTVALQNNSSGSANTATGREALFSNTTGAANTATGRAALLVNTTGNFNTATGDSALYSNTGSNNTATGTSALFRNQTGYENTATGGSALIANTGGVWNTATGFQALASNTMGSNNTATGRNALLQNTTGILNTATGESALYTNSTGGDNTANGYQCLFSNTTGYSNTAEGLIALSSNTTGHNNTATGSAALFHNTIGVGNTADGDSALQQNTTGSNNVALGVNAGFNLTTGSNNIVIGAGVFGTAGEGGKIRIGKQGTQNGTFIAGIYNVSEGGTIKPVYINSTCRLWTQPPASSGRFKTKIKAMDKSSEALLALKPVTFHYKNDEQSTAQFGLIAEEVAKVSPELVVRDDDGEIYTVRYEAVNAMLLNEFLKEHRKLEELKKDFQATVAQQQKEIRALTAGLEAQAAQIQTVSAQLEVNKTAPQ